MISQQKPHGARHLTAYLSVCQYRTLHSFVLRHLPPRPCDEHLVNEQPSNVIVGVRGETRNRSTACIRRKENINQRIHPQNDMVDDCRCRDSPPPASRPATQSMNSVLVTVDSSRSVRQPPSPPAPTLQLSNTEFMIVVCAPCVLKTPPPNLALQFLKVHPVKVASGAGGSSFVTYRPESVWEGR